jgi:hypothetical protein
MLLMGENVPVKSDAEQKTIPRRFFDEAFQSPRVLFDEILAAN